MPLPHDNRYRFISNSSICCAQKSHCVTNGQQIGLHHLIACFVTNLLIDLTKVIHVCANHRNADVGGSTESVLEVSMKIANAQEHSEIIENAISLQHVAQLFDTPHSAVSDA